MRARLLLAALAAAAALFAPAAPAQFAPSHRHEEVAAADLPREARHTLAAIRKGGPYAYAKDGTVFGNREGQLPKRPRGYYREYTVRTPGAKTRGARRIVAGREGDLWYTDDHYRSFRRIRE